MSLIGVYVGNDPRALQDYTNWAGVAPNNQLNYLNHNSWSDFDNSIMYEVNLWKDVAVNSVWSVPLTVWGTPLESVASGLQNGHFLKAAEGLAQTNKADGGPIYVRVGWEFNGSWFPWAASGHEETFVAAFRELVTTFRSVSDRFSFVWDVNVGGGNMDDPTKAYPGDDFVDVVGTDVYYNLAYDSPDPNAAFDLKINQPFGLKWQQDFAAAHGKPTSISEWGVMGDSAGPFIEKMGNWISDNNMVYANYWDSDAGGFAGKLSTNISPATGAYYKAFVESLTSDAGLAASLAVHDTADHVVNGAEAKVTSFTVSGLDNDATAVASFSDGTHVKSVNVGGNGTSAVDLSGFAGTVSSSLAITDIRGNATAVVGNTIQLEVHRPCNTLSLQVSADSWQGDPHFAVLVDGRQVGGIQTTAASHSLGQTQDLTFTGHFGSGAQVQVQFLNDAWGGTDSTDRNLYVHQVTLDGHVYTGEGTGPGGITELFSNGTASFNTSAATPESTLSLQVSADSWQGDPHFAVLVDGRQVGGIQTTAASHSLGQTQDLTFTGHFGSGAQVQVQFLNDAWGGTDSTDRNLYVHQVTLDGHVYTGEGTGPGGITELFSNGTASFNTSAATSESTLSLQVSADSWQGDPHFAVLVDGRQVGGIQTTAASHSLGQTQDLTFTGHFGSGAQVQVQFLNDAWGGTDSTDRNLYVHQVTLDGHVYTGEGTGPGGITELFGNRTASFYVSSLDTGWLL